MCYLILRPLPPFQHKRSFRDKPLSVHAREGCPCVRLRHSPVEYVRRTLLTAFRKTKTQKRWTSRSLEVWKPSTSKQTASCRRIKSRKSTWLAQIQKVHLFLFFRFIFLYLTDFNVKQCLRFFLLRCNPVERCLWACYWLRKCLGLSGGQHQFLRCGESWK